MWIENGDGFRNRKPVQFISPAYWAACLSQRVVADTSGLGSKSEVGLFSQLMCPLASELSLCKVPVSPRSSQKFHYCSKRGCLAGRWVWEQQAGGV